MCAVHAGNYAPPSASQDEALRLQFGALGISLRSGIASDQKSAAA